MDFNNKWKILTGIGTGIMACYTIFDLYLSKQKELQQDKKDDEMINEEINKLNQQLQNHHIFTMKVSESATAKSPLRKKRCIQQIEKQQIFKICISGGLNTDLPTIKADLIDQLTDLGFSVLQVPNIWNTIGEKIELSQKLECQVQFYTTLMNIQIRLEEFFQNIAKMSKGPTVIICEKGVMDLMSYVTDQVWQTIIDNNNWNISQLRDNRYEAVIYITPNSDDEVHQQQVLQQQNSWVGHPHLSIIDYNSKDKNMMVMSINFDNFYHYSKEIIIYKYP